MMQILKLRRLSTNDYRIVVHLDTTKLDGGGLPLDPYVLRLTWPPKPDELTHAQYLTQERPTIRALCVRALAFLEATEGAALPGEGDEL